VTIDKVFAGSIPRIYETHLVPLIFEPYASDLKERVGSMNVSRILEVAAGCKRMQWHCRFQITNSTRSCVNSA
jgi:hypothetical protein